MVVHDALYLCFFYGYLFYTLKTIDTYLFFVHNRNKQYDLCVARRPPIVPQPRPQFFPPKIVSFTCMEKRPGLTSNQYLHYHKPEVQQDDRVMSMKITLESLEDELTKFRILLKKFSGSLVRGSWSSFMACLHEIILNLLVCLLKAYTERKERTDEVLTCIQKAG